MSVIEPHLLESTVAATNKVSPAAGRRRRRKTTEVTSEDTCCHQRIIVSEPLGMDLAFIFPMGSRIRLFEPGIVYNVTHRTNDRAFLFRPNHNPKYPLLDASCPSNALDLSNDIIPVPSVINIIGSSIVRAMDAHPIDLYWCESSSNHRHDGTAAKSEDQLGEVAKFYQHSNSLIARQINKLWNRQGHVFGGPYRMEPCLDNEAAEQKLEYALTNVIKDQLVERVEHSPFFSTFDYLAHGKPLRYWWLDWAGYYAAGGRV